MKTCAYLFLVILLCGCGTSRGEKVDFDVTCVEVTIPFKDGVFTCVMSPAFSYSACTSLQGTSLQWSSSAYTRKDGEVLDSDVWRELSVVLSEEGVRKSNQASYSGAKVVVTDVAGVSSVYFLGLSRNKKMFSWVETYIRDAYLTTRNGSEHFE